ncbi:unnamed protein product [Camellia sinensis]
MNEALFVDIDDATDDEDFKVVPKSHLTSYLIPNLGSEGE